MDPERNKKIKETIARFLAAETPGLTPEVSEDFRRLFGNRQPFFIPLEFATKSKPRVKWTKITPEIIAVDRGQRDFYRGQLNEACSDGGNLAIKVGIESHNLVEIDFDKDEFVEPFLELNPAFRNTLRTFGRRGAGFWFYAVGAYPKEKIDLNVKGDSKDHAG